VSVAAKEAQRIVASVLGLRLDKSLIARFQHLQKHGIPGGTNTGRGTRSEYAETALLRLVVVFDLIAAGLIPDSIQRLIDAGLYGGINLATAHDVPLQISAGTLEKYGGAAPRIDATGALDPGFACVTTYPSQRLAQIRAAMAELER
jgi:hypothetical protein